MGWHPPQATLVTAGRGYIIFLVAYSALLLVSLSSIFYHYRKPAVRVRGAFLILTVVGLVHGIVLHLCIGYSKSGLSKCNVQFWVISVVYPITIAVLQASNVKLLTVAKNARDIPQENAWAFKKESFRLRDLGQTKKWWNQLSYEKKVYVGIAFGMMWQVAIAFLIFYGSRRFSPESGFLGEMADQQSCHRGPEWVPAIFWQFVWFWIIGPIIVWKTRHIHDTHYWLLQTRITVLAGMPGTPLWIFFMLAQRRPLLNKIKYWFPAPMWFLPGLIILQVATIVCPLVAVFKHRNREPKPHLGSAAARSESPHNLIRHSVKPSLPGLENDKAAFEYNLKFNTAAIAKYAAERDFTSENIEFLRRVTAFKKYWFGVAAHALSATHLTLSHASTCHMFQDAARIYFEMVNEATAAIEINIEGSFHKALANMFKNVRYFPEPHQRSAPRRPNFIPVTAGNGNIDLHLHPTGPIPLPSVTDAYNIANTDSDGRIAGITYDTIPSTFNVHVFDAAEKSVAYMTYTNTWRGFAKTTAVVRPVVLPAPVGTEEE